MEKRGLFDNSKVYYQNQNYYERFSDVEDTPNRIGKFLKDKIYGNVLDAGCGSGKFLKILESVSESYTGIDLSPNQIAVAFLKKEKSSSKLLVGDLEKLLFNDSNFDNIISAWVLGTIEDLDKRKQVVEELKRVLKPNGSIYLIENDDIGEFEEIRGHIEDGKTKNYNSWLLNQGFKIVHKIDTYFEFESLDEAQNIIKNIYGKTVSDKVRNHNINHQIVIFEWKK